MTVKKPDGPFVRMPMYPERVGPFVVRGILGRGSMGVVLDAVSPVGHAVALKLLTPPSDPVRAPKIIARFHREAKILARITHPSIVRLIDAGDANGQLYLAMERIDGQSLLEARRAGPFQWDRVLSTALELADGLAHLHEVGVVHRDLKLANILLDRRGRPVIADFGIARDDSATGLTQQGDLLGTPGFIAPELIEGATASPLSDQYALGRMLFELGASGDLWTIPHGTTVFEALDLGLVIDWSRWREGKEWETLRAVVWRMLSRSPIDRFPTMNMVREALRAIERRDVHLFDTVRDAGTQPFRWPPADAQTPTAEGSITQVEHDSDQMNAGSLIPKPLGPSTPDPIAMLTPIAPTEVEGANAPDQTVVPSEAPTPRGESLPPPQRNLRLALPEPSKAALVEDLIGPPLPPTSVGPPATDRSERRIAGLREQLSEARQAKGRERLKAGLIVAPLCLFAGAAAGWFLPRPALVPPNVVLAPLSPEALGDPKASYRGAAPSPKDLTDALNLLANARASLAAKNFDSAERSLKLCIEVADLPECHKTLGAYLSLIGDPAARTHLEHYVRIAPASDDAAAVKKALGGSAPGDSSGDDGPKTVIPAPSGPTPR